MCTLSVHFSNNVDRIHYKISVRSTAEKFSMPWKKFHWYIIYLTLRRLMSYIYMEHPFLMFLDHTQRRSTVGRTPLNQWSARRRDLNLTTHNTHTWQKSMPPVGFEPTISADERPQTYSLDRAATGIGIHNVGSLFYLATVCCLSLLLSPHSADGHTPGRVSAGRENDNCRLK